MCPSRGRTATRLRSSSCALLLFLIAPLPQQQQKLVAAAPTNADLIAYLGGTATGQSLVTVAYTLTVLANETSAIVSLKFDGKVGEVGWLGWGAGTAMTDACVPLSLLASCLREPGCELMIKIRAVLTGISSFAGPTRTEVGLSRTDPPLPQSCPPSSTPQTAKTPRSTRPGRCASSRA